MTDLHIVYNEGRGQMTIHCENFFPCSQATLKKLLNVVKMDYEHEEFIQKEMLTYLEKAEVLERNMKLCVPFSI